VDIVSDGGSSTERFKNAGFYHKALLSPFCGEESKETLNHRKKSNDPNCDRNVATVTLKFNEITIMEAAISSGEFNFDGHSERRALAIAINKAIEKPLPGFVGLQKFSDTLNPPAKEFEKFKGALQSLNSITIFTEREPCSKPKATPLRCKQFLENILLNTNYNVYSSVTYMFPPDRMTKELKYQVDIIQKTENLMQAKIGAPKTQQEAIERQIKINQIKLEIKKLCLQIGEIRKDEKTKQHYIQKINQKQHALESLHKALESIISNQPPQQTKLEKSRKTNASQETLTQEQRKKIEENRQEALLRRQKAMEQQNTSVAPLPQLHDKLIQQREKRPLPDEKATNPRAAPQANKRSKLFDNSGLVKPPSEQPQQVIETPPSSNPGLTARFSLLEKTYNEQSKIGTTLPLRNKQSSDDTKAAPFIPSWGFAEHQEPYVPTTTNIEPKSKISTPSLPVSSPSQKLTTKPK
jgi:hypothetical protein